MSSLRCSLFAGLLLLTIAVQARELFLVAIAKTTLQKISHHKNVGRLLSDSKIAKWGEDLGQEADAWATGDDSWDNLDPSTGSDGWYGNPDANVPPPAESWDDMGGVFGMLTTVLRMIVAMILNFLTGILGMFQQIASGQISFFSHAYIPVHQGAQQSIQLFKQMPKPQKKAIGQLTVSAFKTFDFSLQKKLSQLRGHESAVKSELQHVKKLLEQPHQSANQFAQQLHRQAPKLSSVVAESYKLAVKAFHQRFSKLDRHSKIGFNKIVGNLKKVQLQLSSVLKSATPKDKKALGSSFNFLKNVHTMSRVLL
ncbi:hypothetical protein M3Y94_01008500 [Aphelenchoides besseyi]|nr:hypothetical protein M3Y94_01008500 [Aphelenchoides besseyi]KAI6220464.1 hypothetical protein M3Y95_01042900 [Aphelenchoides besseyi]